MDKFVQLKVLDLELQTINGEVLFMLRSHMGLDGHMITNRKTALEAAAPKPKNLASFTANDLYKNQTERASSPLGVPLAR